MIFANSAEVDTNIESKFRGLILKILGIICEYNPFHTGHAYHISEARRLCSPDLTVGIMSGFFVQRAEPAIVSPEIRVQSALANGMDCVISMPTVFSTASGNMFAEGAIRVFSRISGEKYLAMGTENDGELIKIIADIQSEESNKFTYELKNNLERGLPYSSALCTATAVAAERRIEPNLCREVLSRPNNILAIEYLKAIKKLKTDITPIFVGRIGNDYNDISADGEYISATGARTLLLQKNYKALRRFIPENCFDLLTEECERHPVERKAYEALMINALRTKDIGKSYECCEGIDYRLKKSAAAYSSFDKILSDCKSKRYTMAHIKRICLHTLLGITEDIMKISEKAIGKLIGIKESLRNRIRILKHTAVRNSDFFTAQDITAFADIDGYAGSLYSIITGHDGNEFWDNKLITL